MNESMLPELPEGWVYTRLGEIIEFEYGKGLREDKRDRKGNVPVYGSNGIVGYHSVPLIEKPCLIVGRKGAAGNVHLSKIPCWPIDTTYYIIPPDELNLTFLYYLLSTLNLNSLDKSTAIPGLNRNDAYALKIPLTPLPEQRRIVTKLEELFTRLDAGVEVLKKTQAQLKHYRQSVLKAACEGKLVPTEAELAKAEGRTYEPADVLLARILKERREKNKGAKYKEPVAPDTSGLPALPEGWVWTRVGDISKIIHYGYTASSANEPIGPKMLRITDIQNNSVNWDVVPYCKIELQEKQKYLLKDGDLVFARTGATVGKSFLIRGNIPEAVFASYLIRIILSENVEKEFVYNFFQSNRYWLQIHEGQIGIGQPNVNSQVLSRIVLPLPPLAEQRRIVAEVERHLSIADGVERTVEQSLRQSERLRQSILKKAFEGKLVAQDERDEPAEKLIKRIRIEREKSRIKKGRKNK